jgi:hypothetical protein
MQVFPQALPFLQTLQHSCAAYATSEQGITPDDPTTRKAAAIKYFM